MAKCPLHTKPTDGRAHGAFRYFVGETRVENIGENQTGGCNLRVTFVLRKAKEDQGR